jgi:hypothetical protein
MQARSHILRIALSAALGAAVAFPAASLAEYYVPPGNSAANQYTESLPGAGGDSGGKHKGVTPASTLGAGNAKKLEKQGSAGKAAAEVAAQTAPPQLIAGGGTSGSGTTAPSGGGSAGSGGGNGGSNGGGGDLGEATRVSQPQGSSGVGQVLGQATGASDGNLGLWLPLAIVLTLIGSVAYWVRGRHGHGQAA